MILVLGVWTYLRALLGGGGGRAAQPQARAQRAEGLWARGTPTIRRRLPQRGQCVTLVAVMPQRA